MFVDKKFRKARNWSNNQLKIFAPLFEGDVVNVSGWQDLDKQGDSYKSYFKNCKNYWITNYKSEARGFQGDLENEYYLDLEARSNKINRTFDCVFNHTVLEHVFEVQTAFQNLCSLSEDIVILVVPFLQEQHADYGDYWRFTPMAIERLFKKNKMQLLYLNYNDEHSASIYLFAIASKKFDNWRRITETSGNKVSKIDSIRVGTKIIKNNLGYKIFYRLKKFFSSD